MGSLDGFLGSREQRFKSAKIEVSELRPDIAGFALFFAVVFAVFAVFCWFPGEIGKKYGYFRVKKMGVG